MRIVIIVVIVAALGIAGVTAALIQRFLTQQTTVETAQPQVFAAASDLARYEIPNWLSIFLVVAFLALALGLGMAWDELAKTMAAGKA